MNQNTGQDCSREERRIPSEGSGELIYRAAGDCLKWQERTASEETRKFCRKKGGIALKNSRILLQAIEEKCLAKQEEIPSEDKRGLLQKAEYDFFVSFTLILLYNSSAIQSKIITDMSSYVHHWYAPKKPFTYDFNNLFIFSFFWSFYHYSHTVFFISLYLILSIIVIS